MRFGAPGLRPLTKNMVRGLSWLVSRLDNLHLFDRFLQWQERQHLVPLVVPMDSSEADVRHVFPVLREGFPQFIQDVTLHKAFSEAAAGAFGAGKAAYPTGTFALGYLDGSTFVKLAENTALASIADPNRQALTVLREGYLPADTQLYAVFVMAHIAQSAAALRTTLSVATIPAT